MSGSVDDKPYITCHVLDTIAGKPAASVSVKLTVLSPLPKNGDTYNWTAKTDKDGRVTAWTGATTKDVDSTESIQMAPSVKEVNWKLTFDTETYFGKGKTFWPEVQLVFSTKADQKHYHVPLLLGPWSYTTYRGS